MLIKEAIKMLQRMNPNDQVILEFEEDVTEYRNNEHLIKPDDGKRKEIQDNIKEYGYYKVRGDN